MLFRKVIFRDILAVNFSMLMLQKIGFIRENIENNKSNLTDKEYYILLASLLYSVDKIANTVGHFDAYLKKEVLDDNFINETNRHYDKMGQTETLRSCLKA
jgi:adenine-specific DNA methylase